MTQARHLAIDPWPTAAPPVRRALRQRLRPYQHDFFQDEPLSHAAALWAMTVAEALNSRAAQRP